MKQNNHNNFRNYSKEIIPYSSIQYTGLIALSKVFLVLLHLKAHSTDSGLDHSTPQIHVFNTRSPLFASAQLFPTQRFLQALRHMQHSTIVRQLATECNSLYDTAVSLLLAASLLCHLCASRILNPIPVTRSRSDWLSRSFSRRCWHSGKPGGLASEALQVTAILGAGVFCCCM